MLYIDETSLYIHHIRRGKIMMIIKKCSFWDILHLRFWYQFIFGNQSGELIYARSVGFVKNVAYPLKSLLFSSNKVPSWKSKKLWAKGHEWNNAVYEEKEKYRYFTHLAQDTTNSNPNFNQRKNGNMRKERIPTPGARKSKTRKK